jgi:hypothetical protein
MQSQAPTVVTATAGIVVTWDAPASKSLLKRNV